MEVSVLGSLERKKGILQNGRMSKDSIGDKITESIPTSSEHTIKPI